MDDLDKNIFWTGIVYFVGFISAARFMVASFDGSRSYGCVLVS